MSYFSFISRNTLGTAINYIFEKFIVSLFIQFFYFKIVNYQNKDKYNLWFFIGDSNKFNLLNETIKDKRDIKLTNEPKELKSFLKDKDCRFQGFLTEKTEDMKILKDISIELRINKLEQITINSFCQNYLYKMPSNIINTNILKHKSDNYNFQTRLKYVSDVFISILLITFCLPIFIIISILIKIEDRGPIFYSQIRVGQYGENFKIWKFRTMKINAENNGPEWSRKGDNRVTILGKFLRISRIDELPQLLCVLRGEMSLIGPRPERPEIEKMIEKEINYYSYRRLFKPGLSGWAQVNYPYGASINDSREKLSYDIFYIENFSNLLDLVIFFKTIKLIFNLKGAIAK
jgi:lipopolysaccharide/colanic/teichoic acid biosynthesis glycosyltransferase